VAFLVRADRAIDAVVQDQHDGLRARLCGGGQFLTVHLEIPVAFARSLASTTGAVLDLDISPEALTPRMTLSQMRAAGLAAQKDRA
jgi:hypothetical protein